MLRKALAPIAQDRCFLCWQPVTRGNRVEKVPCDPESGRIPKSGNSAAQRGVLTLDEALAAAEKHGCGIGIVPGKATSAKLVGLDFDDALSTTGVFRDSLAQIAGAPDCYLEISPSGSGLRGLYIGEVTASDIRSGAEIGSVGLYFGPSKFVTVTGRHWGGPQDLVAAPEVTDRAIDRMRHLAASKDAAGTLSSYHGQAGLQTALRHIESGAALHEPLMFIGGYLVRTTMYRGPAIEAYLYDLMAESKARDDDPERFDERIAQIPRWTAGAIRKFGNSWQKLANGPSEEDATNKVRGVLGKLPLKKEGEVYVAPSEEEQEEARKQRDTARLEEALLSDPDIASLYREGETLDEFVARLDEEEHRKGQDARLAFVRDVFREQPVGPDFPVGCLPRVVEMIASKVDEGGGTCRNMTACAMLIAASSVHEGTTCIRLASGNSATVASPILRGLSVARPGSRKTNAHGIGKAGVAAVQDDLTRRYTRLFTQALRKAKDEGLTDKQAEEAARKEVPLAPEVLTSSGTAEGIRDALADEGQRLRPVAVYVDEIMTYFQAMVTQRGGASSGQSIALEGYDIGPFVFKKAGGKRANNIHVENLLFSIYGSVQEKVIAKFMEDHDLTADGFLDRFALIMGKPMREVELEDVDLDDLDDDEAEDEAVHSEEEVALWKSVCVEASRFDAKTYRMSKRAHRRWLEFFEKMKRQAAEMAAAGLPDLMVTGLNKSSGAVARIALVLHIIEQAERNVELVYWDEGSMLTDQEKARWALYARTTDPFGAQPATVVSDATMQRAIRLYDEWLVPHLYTFAYATSPSFAEPARAIAGWLIEQDKAGKNHFDMRGFRKGPRALRSGTCTLQQAEARLEMMVAWGWLDYDEETKGWASPRGLSRRFSDALEARRRTLEQIKLRFADSDSVNM